MASSVTSQKSRPTTACFQATSLAITLIQKLRPLSTATIPRGTTSPLR